MSTATLPPPAVRRPATRPDGRTAAGRGRPGRFGVRPAPARAPPRLDGESNGMLLTPDQFDAVEDYDPGLLAMNCCTGVVVVSPDLPTEAHEAGIDELGTRIAATIFDASPQGVAQPTTPCPAATSARRPGGGRRTG